MIFEFIGAILAISITIIAFAKWRLAQARIDYTWQIQNEIVSVCLRIGTALDLGTYDRSEIIRWVDHLRAITGLSPSTMSLSDYGKRMKESKFRVYELYRDSVSGGVDEQSESPDQ